MRNLIPNAITMMNLLCGSLSLIYTMHHNLKMAALFILIAMIMDGIDGRAARLLHVSSELGKELDSLCDLVSFGVAPAILVFSMLENPGAGYLNWGLTAVCLFFILCGAFRLARFNILNITDHFLGIPITIAGSIVAAVALLFPGLSFWPWIGLMIFLGLFMISKVTIPKP